MHAIRHGRTSSHALALGVALLILLAAVPSSAGADTLLGGQLELPSGASAVGKHGVGSWIVLDLYAGRHFGKRRQTWVQLRAPVVMVSPGALNNSLLGGADLELRSPLTRSLGVYARLAWLRPGFLAVSQFGLPTSNYVGDPQFGVAFGTTLTYRTGSTSLVAEPTVTLQRASAQGVGVDQSAFHLPLSITHVWGPKFTGSFQTGAYLGPNLSYKPNEGLQVPAIFDGSIAVGDATRVGIQAGVGNSVPNDFLGIADTLFFAVRLEHTLRSEARRKRPVTIDDDDATEDESTLDDE